VPDSKLAQSAGEDVDQEQDEQEEQPGDEDQQTPGIFRSKSFTNAIKIISLELK
jgi:hypothetical protein